MFTKEIDRTKFKASPVYPYLVLNKVVEDSKRVVKRLCLCCAQEVTFNKYTPRRFVKGHNKSKVDELLPLVMLEFNAKNIQEQTKMIMFLNIL
jgi:hypothetical protein